MAVPVLAIWFPEDGEGKTVNLLIVDDEVYVVRAIRSRID